MSSMAVDVGVGVDSASLAGTAAGEETWGLGSGAGTAGVEAQLSFALWFAFFSIFEA